MPSLQQPMRAEHLHLQVRALRKTQTIQCALSESCQELNDLILPLGNSLRSIQVRKNNQVRLFLGISLRKRGTLPRNKPQGPDNKTSLSLPVFSWCQWSCLDMRDVTYNFTPSSPATAPTPDLPQGTGARGKQAQSSPLMPLGIA